MDLLGAKGSAAIVFNVGKGNNRFSSLSRAISGINRQTLAQRLLDLTKQGILERKASPGRSQRVEYHLTHVGVDLLPALEAMAKWGAEDIRMAELIDLS